MINALQKKYFCHRVFLSLVVIACLNSGVVPTHLSQSVALAAPTTSQVGNPRSLALNQQGLDAIKNDKPEEAERFLRQALKEDSGNLTAAFNLAGILSFNKKKDEALALLEKYTTQYKLDPGLFVRYADLLLSSGKIKEAATQYERGFALDKKYPRLTAKMGLTYALLNRLDESEQMYLAAVAAEPNDGELMGNLASVLLGNGKTEKALSTAKEAVRIAPKKETYVTLGSAYESKKEFKSALNAFRKAQELGAQSEELTEKIEQLSKLTA